MSPISSENHDVDIYLFEMLSPEDPDDAQVVMIIIIVAAVVVGCGLVAVLVALVYCGVKKRRSRSHRLVVLYSY